jgi:hypothetical protein
VRVSLPTITVKGSMLLLPMLLLGACDDRRASEARKKIRAEHAPRVAQIVREDLARHREGLRRAADRMAAGFVKVEGEQQEREIRQVLQLIRSPKKGVRELVISPLSFIAAVDKNGVVIARDTDPDPMKGMNLAEMFPSVRTALAGEEATEVNEFESQEKEDGEQPTAAEKMRLVTVLMAAPSHYKGEVVGALVLGIPLWRLQQRLSKQLQMEEAGKKAGVVIWAYVYRGDQLHHHGTPQSLEEILPDPATRKAGLDRSPGGFTGEVAQYSFWYGYGVRPLPVLGEDIGAIILRMDPQ